jgi:glyoxylate reductase
MTAPVVVATSSLPEPSLSTLEGVDLRVLEGVRDEQDIIREISDAEALICLLTHPVTARVIAAAPHLKIVANCAVGVDNVDRAACAAREIWVTNTPDVLTDATADLTFALLLALARRIIAGDRLVRAGGFSGWEPNLLLGRELRGCTLGIVGPGRIGRAVSRRGRAFGMTVIAFGRSARDEGNPDDPPRVSFDDLLERADFISIHVPLTPETHHMFRAETFARMKPGALLVNTARGPIVDEVALVRALDAGSLAGAALDVFEREPIVLPALLDEDRVILTPHLGSATLETRREMARIVVEDVRRVLRGGPPVHAVAPEGAVRWDL